MTFPAVPRSESSPLLSEDDPVALRASPESDEALNPPQLVIGDDLTPQVSHQSSTAKYLYYHDRKAFRNVLIALWSGSFLCALDSTIVASIMGRIAADLGASNQASWIATSYLISNTVFQALYGRASDILGRRPTLLFAQFFFGIGCLLSGMSTSITMFAVARVVAGVGGGGLPALSSITVSDLVPLERRSAFQGYANVVFSVGQLLGAPLGGFLADSVGWKATFIVQVPITVYCAVLTVMYVTVDRGNSGVKGVTRESLRGLDIPGSSALLVTLSTFLLALSAPKTESTGAVGIFEYFCAKVCPFIAIAGAIVFYKVEQTAESPIVPGKLLKGGLGRVSLSVGLVLMAINPVLYLVPLYLQTLFGKSATYAGAVLVFSVLGSALGSVVAGHWLSRDRTEAAAVMRAAAARMMRYSVFHVLFGVSAVFAVVAVALLSRYATIGLVLGLAIAGFGLGGVYVASLMQIISITGRAGQATATGMNYFFRSTGNILGISLVLHVYQTVWEHGLWKAEFPVSEAEKAEIISRIVRNTQLVQSLPEAVKSVVSEVYVHAVFAGLICCVVPAGVAVFVSPKPRVQTEADAER